MRRAETNARPRAIRGRPGFTMTELLVTLFLSSIGMVTVFGVQIAANLVQRHARDINAARMLGESFITQLRGETVNWTTPGYDTDCNSTDMPLCAWALGPAGGAGVWVAAPDTTTQTWSPTFNALGIPGDSADPRVVSGTNRDRLNNHNQRYCVHYNIEPVGQTVSPGEMFRAQVRVYWPTRDDAMLQAVGTDQCGFADPAALATAADDDGLFRYIQLNTVLYRHEDII